MPLSGASRQKQYIVSIVTVVGLSALCYAFNRLIPYQLVALVLLLAVSLLAISYELFPVLLAAALSAFIWDIFFIPPRFTIHVSTGEDTVLLIMYFVLALVNGVLTHRLRKVEKMARLKEERANSVKLYNTILNSLSHELKTPIAAIIGATDNLQGNPNLGEENKQQLIKEISKASLRLNQQVDNLLNISRLESGHIKPHEDWTDIIELVFEVVREVEDNNPGRKVGVSINQAMPLCKTDKGMLKQVMYNLVNNAALHTPAGTPIEITASCHTDVLEVIIEDGGKGFSQSTIEELMEKFSRERKSPTAGSGLGLSIVKGFTEALYGNVEIGRSELGGAKFTLAFPVKTNYMTL
jgi:two-component system, OmpR family, sensor histidine kinase KdpD